MPPKRAKQKPTKKKPETPRLPDQNVLAEEDEAIFSQTAEVDVSDLTPEFFNVCNKLVQTLMESERRYEASKVKKLSDMLYLLIVKYANEVQENEKLRPQVERANVKLQIALELSACTHEVVDSLQCRLTNSWKVADASQAREEDTQKQLVALAMKCETASRKEEKEEDDTAELGKLAKYKNILLRERDRLSSEVTDYRKRLQMQRYYTESLEYINKTYEDTINSFLARIRALERDKSNLSAKLKQYQSSIEEMREMNMKLMQKLDITTKEFEDTSKNLGKKIKEFDNLRYMYDKQAKELQLSNRQVTKNEQEIVALKNEAKKQDDLMQKLRLEDRAKENSIKQYQFKLKQVQQHAGNISSKLYKANKMMSSLQGEVVQLKNKIHAKDKDIAAEHQRAADIQRTKDSLQHERDNLRSEIVKLNNQAAEMKHSNVLLQNANDVLRLDISKLNVKLDENKIHIAKVEKERNEVQQEMETLQERIEYLKEQIQMKTDQITDLTEKLEQMTKQVFNMKRQLEDCHIAKMVMQRSYETCAQERNELRTHQTHLNHQIVQLTNEITQNENKINSLNLSIEKLNTEKKDLQTQLKSTNNLLSIARRDLKAMKEKNDILIKTIESDDKKFRKMANEIDTLRKEKNLTGLQMVRRNDEIVLLKEKFDIMQTALDQGQSQYKSSLEDIRLLKTEVINLKTERDNLMRAMESTADMRREIIRLNKLLNQERVKVRALFEDVKMPTGVHRWRMLQGKDPAKMHLVDKIKRLQQLNFQKDIADKNLKTRLHCTMEEAEKLKHITETLPTTDLGRQLILQQRINVVRTRQLKAAMAELNIMKVEVKSNYCEARNIKLPTTQDDMEGFTKEDMSANENEKLFDYNCIEDTASLEKLVVRPARAKLIRARQKPITKYRRAKKRIQKNVVGDGFQFNIDSTECMELRQLINSECDEVNPSDYSDAHSNATINL